MSNLEFLSFKDLFSRQSSDYARFRPQYPDALFGYLASVAPGKTLAWDVGTGSGQAAVKLTEFFEQVIATDPSKKQIASAIRHSKVEYQVGSAERTEFANKSFDLITVAQAFHWFRQEDFFSEAVRVLKLKGVLAIWSYGLAKITPEVDAVVLRLYQDILGSYWEDERRLVEEGYKSVRLPLQEITPPPFEMSAEWSLEHLIGYLGTWSALQTYIQKNSVNPLEEMYPTLKSAWGSEATRLVQWELAVRVGRNG